MKNFIQFKKGFDVTRHGIFAFITLSALLQSCAPSMRFTSSQTHSGSGLAVSHSEVRERTEAPQRATTIEGYASYYGDEFHGRLTANGEVFDQSLLTAAHKTLPFGTIVRITNLRNNRSVVVKVNDRGPFVVGRVIDLSRAAAEKLDMIREGVVHVELTILN